jgi:hypothetical protein
MNILTWANILYPIFAVSAMMLLTNRDRRGFLVFLIVEVLMLYIGILSEQWGIAGMAILYAILNIHGYLKWRKVK